MEQTSKNTPTIVHLAARLEGDIREKNLTPGAPYLTTLEAARLLGVSNVAANRAMQLLVKRDVLRRRQRSGTFIADAQTAASSSIKRVHMLVHQSYLKTEGILADGVILGIQEKLPQAEIQFNFMPNGDEANYTEQLVAESLRSPRAESFVLVRAPLDVQRIVERSGLPAVIHGTPFPSIKGIPWVDRDHAQSGQLAANWLIRQGCRSISIITRDKPLPGDFAMTDAVSCEVRAASLAADSMSWRPSPMDALVVGQIALDALAAYGRPHGFICRSNPYATVVVNALAENGMKLGVDAFVVALDVYKNRAFEAPPFPYLQLTSGPEEVGQHIGEMLVLQAKGQITQPSALVVPVTILES